MSDKKDSALRQITDYMSNEGISVADLAGFQGSQVETTDTPEIRPADLEGVSNDPCLSNSDITARLAALETRFNILSARQFNSEY